MITTSTSVHPAASTMSVQSIVSANTNRRLPPPSSRSTTTYHFPSADDANEPNYADDLPLNYIHVPTTGQRGSSSSSLTSALSSFSNQAKVALSTIGSPPRRISYCDDNCPLVASAGNSGLPNNSSPPAIFRLEPKFRNNAKCMLTPRSDCGATSGRGRKRTAQSLSYYNNNTSHSANVAAASRGTHPSQTAHRGLTPVIARRVDTTVINFQGLSIRSPGSVSTATFDNSSLNQSAVDFRICATSPAATHSSFTACGSSSFSKVCHTNNSPATSNDETPFLHFRSGSFGSMVAQSPSCEMPPPRHVEISSSSPRIVPLTVLTHDSIPVLTHDAIPANSVSTGNKFDINHSVSGSSVGGSRSLLGHGFANGKSPLILPVDSSSTSDEGTSKGGETIQFSTASKHDSLFKSDDYQIMMIRTPQRPLPPLTSVQYCPDSAASNMSMMHDSPVTAASLAFRTAAIIGSDKTLSRNSPSVVRTPLPKISLTPRSGSSPNRSAAPFPEFPSPSPDLDQQHEPIIWPHSSNTLNSRSSVASRQRRPPASLLLDIAPESQTTTVLDDSCSLDLSMDPSSSPKIKSISNESDKQKSRDSLIPFPSWGHHLPRSKPPNALLVDAVPHDSLFPSKSKEIDILNATAESTPTAPTRGSLKDIVVEVGGNLSEKRQCCADTETLSDVDDDDFFLAIPSTLAEEKQEMASFVEGTTRQTKQPRLNHQGTTSSVNSTSEWMEHYDRRHTPMTSSLESNSSLQGTRFAVSSASLRGMDSSSNPDLFGMIPNAEFMEHNVRRRTSMTSVESNSSLLGAGFVLSSASLRGMDSSSNLNLFGMISKVHVQQGSSSCLTNHAIGEGMKRDTSMASIGLDLDPEVCLSSKNDNLEIVYFDGPAGRDLVTPPVMAPALHPPPLSPRFGSLKNESIS
jgi:hypothetical protein